MIGHLNVFLWYKLAFRDIEVRFQWKFSWLCFCFLVQRTTKSDRYGVLKIHEAQ